MEIKVKINKTKFWQFYKISNCKLWIKGSFNSHKIDQVLNSLNRIRKPKIKNFLKTLDGHFAFIFINKNYCLIATDRIRSTPLHLSKIDGDIHVSDSSNSLVKSKNFIKKINKDSVREISMGGFTIGSKSIYSNLITPIAGEYILIENDTIIKNTYFSYFGKLSKKNYDSLLKELTDITLLIFRRLLRQVGSRQIVVPLSAGNDSRLVVSILFHLGAKNVKCYSYGQRGNFESEVSKSIAKKLNYEWIFVPLTHNSERKFYNSNDYKDFLKFSENHSAIPFIQSISTFNFLKEKKFIDKDCVFVNGNSGDFLSGCHINKLYENLSKFNKNQVLSDLILDQLIDKHFSLWGYLKTKKNIKEIKNQLWNSITKHCNNLNLENAHLFYEYSEFIDRQSKYVISGQRIYEFYDYDWKLPLWDDEYIFFWKKVPSKFKYKQMMYLDMLKRNNFGGVWCNSLPVNSYKINPKWIIPIRFIFKLPFGLIGSIGKKLWHHFDTSVFRYWIDPTLIICSTSYKEILKDIFKKPRNAFSWLSKNYLKNFNLY